MKRPGGVFWYDLEPAREDGHGSWLYGPIGARWGARHAQGGLAVPPGARMLQDIDRPLWSDGWRLLATLNARRG